MDGILRCITRQQILMGFVSYSGGYTIYPYLLQIFFFALERNFIRAVTGSTSVSVRAPADGYKSSSTIGHGIVPSSNIIGWICIIISIPFVNLVFQSPFWEKLFLTLLPDSKLSCSLLFNSFCPATGVVNAGGLYSNHPGYQNKIRL